MPLLFKRKYIHYTVIVLFVHLRRYGNDVIEHNLPQLYDSTDFIQ